MIEWMVAWGVTQATGFAFKSLMEELATDAAKDYTKDFFKDCIGKVVRSPNKDPLKEACGKAIKAFLQLVQEEFEDNEYSAGQIRDYEEPLKALIAHPDVMTALRSPFDPDCRIVETRVLVETWAELKLRFLPEDFDWDTLGKNYGKAVRKIWRESGELRSLFQEQREEEIAAGITELAGIQPDADLGRYAEGLREFYGGLRLDSLDTTGAYYSEMKLWQVFVPQNVRECREFLPKAYEIPKEHIRLLQERGELDEIALAEELFERSRRTYAEQPLAPVFEIVGHPQHPEKRAEVQYTVILGDPGSGKSTLLQYIALTWAKRPLRDLPRYPLPVMIELRTYARNKRDGKCKDILSFIHSGEIVNRLNQQYLHEQLKRGHAIALLDGLDEVFDPQLRDEVVTDIHRFTNDYKQVPAIVTSRWLGYKAQRLRDAEFRHFMLQDFDEKQIAAFIEKWHNLTFPAAVQGERWRKQERLERAIANSKAIRELAVNPLLLTMMAILNRNRELPKDRPELYNKASEVLLYQWDVERKLIQQHIDLKAIDYRDKQGMLREVAYRMQASEKGLSGNLIAGEELRAILREYLTQNTDADKPIMVSRLLVEQLRTRNFILCDLGADSYAFIHRTFLEYFCARAFVWRFEKAHTLTLEDLKTEVFGKHWDDESWHEVLRLITGMIESHFAGEVIEFLLEQDGEDEQFANVFLAAECLLEVQNRAEILECDRAVLSRVQELARFPFDFFDREYINMAEMSSVFTIRNTAIIIVAEIWHEKKTTKNWLKTLAHSADIGQQVVHEVARGWKDDSDTLLWLKMLAQSEEHPSVREIAVQEVARGWKDEPDTLTWLKMLAQSEEHTSVRKIAVQEVARGWKDEPDTLPRLTTFIQSDKDFIVRKIAVQEVARGWKDNPNTLTILKNLAQSDEDWPVRRTAVEELANGWQDDPKILSLLKNLAQSDEISDVRSQAVEGVAQGWKNDPDTLPWLKNLAQSDEDSFVRFAAVEGLAREWKDAPSILPLLKNLAQFDEDLDVRCIVMGELARAWKDEPSVLAILKTSAQFDENAQIRETALEELAQEWKEDSETLAILKILAQSDEDASVRRLAVHVLAREWKKNSKTLPIFKIRAQSDEDVFVRRVAMEALAQEWKDDPELFEVFCNIALYDRFVREEETQRNPRKMALKALIKNYPEHPRTLEILKHSSEQDSDEKVREFAREQYNIFQKTQS